MGDEPELAQAATTKEILKPRHPRLLPYRHPARRGRGRIVLSQAGTFLIEP